MTIIDSYLPYTYKFSRDVNFANDPNLGFQQLFLWIFCYHTLCITTVLQNFKDLNFVDDKLPAKTVKFTSLENLYVYGILSHYRGQFEVVIVTRMMIL